MSTIEQYSKYKMKTLLTILLITATSIASQAGPSWGFTLGNGAGFYYGGNNNRRGNGCYQPQNAYIVGPQYYVAQQPATYYPVQYRNYSNAPVVIRQGCGQSIIVPNSWR